MAQLSANLEENRKGAIASKIVKPTTQDDSFLFENILLFFLVFMLTCVFGEIATK